MTDVSIRTKYRPETSDSSESGSGELAGADLPIFYCGFT